MIRKVCTFFNCQNNPIHFYGKKYFVLDNYIFIPSGVLDLRKVSKSYYFNVLDQDFKLEYKNLEIDMNEIRSGKNFIALGNRNIVNIKFGKSFFIINYKKNFSVLNYNLETLLTLSSYGLVYHNLVLCNGKLLNPEPEENISLKTMDLNQVVDINRDNILTKDKKIISRTDQKYFLSQEELKDYAFPGMTYFSFKKLPDRKIYLFGSEKYQSGDLPDLKNVKPVEYFSYLPKLDKELKEYLTKYPVNNPSTKNVLKYLLNLIDYLLDVEIKSYSDKRFIENLLHFRQKYPEKLKKSVKSWIDAENNVFPLTWTNLTNIINNI